MYPAVFARPFSFCHLTDRSIKQYYKGFMRSARPPAGGVMAATCQVSHFIILTAEQRIHAPNDGLALALFVLWILTNDSDATFSFDNFAFLADRFYRRSNLHDESSFLCSLAPRVGEFSVVNFWNAFSFCGLEKSPRAKVRFIV